MQVTNADTALTGTPVFLAPGYPWGDDGFMFLVGGSPNPFGSKEYQYRIDRTGDTATVQVWSVDQSIRVENIGPDDLHGTQESQGDLAVYRAGE
jgi:hypothetical protein